MSRFYLSYIHLIVVLRDVAGINMYEVQEDVVVYEYI